MTKLYPFFTLAFMLVAAPAGADDEAPITCSASDAAHVVEGTYVGDLAPEDAEAEAEASAAEVAEAHCADIDGGAPVYLDARTRTSGAVTVRELTFVCRDAC